MPGRGAVHKVPALRTRGPELNPYKSHKIQTRWHMLPVLGRQRRTKGCSLLAGQPSLCGKFQANERLKNQGVWCLRNKDQVYPLAHACTHTVFKRRFVCLFVFIFLQYWELSPGPYACWSHATRNYIPSLFILRQRLSDPGCSCLSLLHGSGRP